MNHIFKSIYNTALGTCVVCSELSRAKGKRASSSVGGAATALALTAVGSFFPFDSVYAACRDVSRASNLAVYASGGDTCDATHPSYSRNNVAVSTGDGSVLNFIQDSVKLDGEGVRGHILSIGGSNAGSLPTAPGATVNANNLTVVSEYASSYPSHLIYIRSGTGAVGGQNTLNVEGSLTTRHDASSGTSLFLDAAKNANGEDLLGGVVNVKNNIDMTSRFADSIRLYGKSAQVNIGGNLNIINNSTSVGHRAIRMHNAAETAVGGNLSITTQNAGGIEGESSATLTALGTSRIGTQGDGATAISLTGGSAVQLANNSVDITTQGANAHAVVINGAGAAAIGANSQALSDANNEVWSIPAIASAPVAQMRWR
ncbi:ESPR domain-containing protein [Testudinibacter sp. P27/CKL/0425]